MSKRNYISTIEIKMFPNGEIGVKINRIPHPRFGRRYNVNHYITRNQKRIMELIHAHMWLFGPKSIHLRTTNNIPGIVMFPEYN
jgi:hypothetical protein